MKKLWIVTKNELLRYFISPLAYVYLFGFLILNASFCLYFGDFFNRGTADLNAMFDFHPWLYLLFISGISMRVWAEEFRTNTIIQIATMPISIKTLVWGKFLAAWLFCGVALLLTFPFWITVNILGQPDNGVILSGYIASFILAGCMLAIAQTMSALTKNQIIALVLAVIANLFFFWSGIEYILSFFRLFLPDTITDTIASFSFIQHFHTLSRGLIELRDAIFFVSIILFFNFSTVFIVNYKTSGTSGWLKSNNKNYFIFAWLMLLVGFFGVNIIANSLLRNIQYDATEEKIYTLTESTNNILKNLPEPVVAKLYFSPELEKRNSNIRQLFDVVRIILEKYKSAANGNFEYKIYYPQFLGQEEDIALANGVQPIPLIDLNQNALFGLTLEDSLQNVEVIPFFTNENPGYIEQEITAKLRKINRVKKTVGIITSDPIFGSQENDGTFIKNPWDIIKLIEQNYKIINIVKPQDFNSKFDVLILFNLRNISRDFVNEIEKYSKNNGKIIAILDAANESSRLYSYQNQPLVPADLGELEDFWKIKFYNRYVVADLDNSITVDTTVDYKTNPIFSQDVIQFKIDKANINPYHPITQNLHEILFASASVFAPEPQAFKNKEISFIPLIKSGDVSTLMPSSVVIDGLNPKQVLQYFQPDDNQKILAAEVIGNTEENPFDLIVIGDSDFLYDSFWEIKNKYLENEFIVNQFDNANFLLNAIDYLAGDTSLLQLRGKRAAKRNFAGIEKLRRINSLYFTQSENHIFEEIEKTKDALKEIWQKKDFEERENFSADELALLTKVRSRLNDLRGDLSKLRMQAFSDISRISYIVTLINLAAVPLLFLIILAIIFLYKHRNLSVSLPFDKKLAYLSLLCLTIFALGLLTVYFSHKSTVDSYENKPAFPEIMKKINDINTVVIRNTNEKLTFVNENNQWILQEHPEFPVYQERIRHLLLTIGQASLFEKKSDKAENLKIFKLNPIEDKTSQVTQIELMNGSNSLEKIFIGDINIDLGRGDKAAYMRRENQFQVWKIKADFVDLNLDWHNWTYSNLWDLRFGRIFAPYQDEKEQQRTVILMKELLNTPILEINNEKPKNPMRTLYLTVEDGNFVNISLYRDKDDAYATYTFDINNENKHLKLMQSRLENKTVRIDVKNLEKILNVFKQ